MGWLKMNKHIILNKIDADKKFKRSIWNPQGEFMRELELQRIKADIKPRKHDIMKAQNQWLDELGYTNDLINTMIKKGALK